MSGVYLYEARHGEGQKCNYCEEKPATHVVVPGGVDDPPKYAACLECGQQRVREAGDAGYYDYLEEIESRKTLNVYGHCPVCSHWYDQMIDPDDETIICNICGCDF